MLMISQKVGSLKYWQENSDFPPFRPKGVEFNLDTLGSFKEKCRSLCRCWEFLVSANPLIFNGVCFDRDFHTVLEPFSPFYFYCLFFCRQFARGKAFLSFPFGRVWVVLKRTKILFCFDDSSRSFPTVSSG